MRDHARIRSDYKTSLPRTLVTRRNPHWRLRGAAFVIGLVVLGIVTAKPDDPDTGAPAVAGEVQQVALALPPPRIPTQEITETMNGDGEGNLDWTTLTVRSGDALSRLLQRNGIPSATVRALMDTGDTGTRLAQLHPGDRIDIARDAHGDVVRLVRELSTERRLVFERNGDGFTGELVEEELERREAVAYGTIESSLFAAGTQAGLSNHITAQLARIFGWDIDFAMDLRRGDEFRLVHEVLYRDGTRVRDGRILAAEFTNRGRTYRAIRYTTPDGETDYYAPDGSSMRRAFLRAPLEYSRITSGFGPRQHPKLHTIRNHNGVDYAAPTGTPIRATGDGRIVRRGPWGGYGHTIVIQHGERYRTLYAHLSRYRSGQGVGTRVRQGDVIGYVGASGLATGPHLHYEFLVDGHHRDPQRVELPSGDPVPEEFRDHFRERIRPRVAQLDTLNRVYADLGG